MYSIKSTYFLIFSHFAVLSLYCSCIVCVSLTQSGAYLCCISEKCGEILHSVPIFCGNYDIF